MSRDIDLDLQSLWFARSPPALPSAIKDSTRGCTTTWSHAWQEDYSKTEKTLVAVVRWLDDLSATKIQIIWIDSDPEGTVEARQQHYPPPAPMGEEQLEHARECYGERIARYCERRVGTQVGNGDCWVLAQRALQHVAADCSNRNEEPVMVSQRDIHGYCILTHCAPSPGSSKGMLKLAGVARGDIIQIKSAQFKHVDFDASTGLRSERNIRLAAHTAVIYEVDGDVLRVLEQNTQFGRRVGEEDYVLKDMLRGELKIFRAVGEQWCPPIDPVW
ncbi:MAG: hypothetical protein M1835_005988 [Candelina submexicana]|nr:MAG: hypothetical protein M1835_005988 [Candelina submexicana]